MPAGNRIYRMPYFDPDGNMTIAQWHTASLGVDYRLPPLEAIGETFTWELPADIAPGPVRVTAVVYMTRVVSSVVDFMGIPEDEKVPMVMGRTETTLNVRAG